MPQKEQVDVAVIDICAVPEMQQAMVFEAVLAQILAALPQSNDAYEAACAQREAMASAAKISAQCARDSSYNITSAVAAATREIATKMVAAEETKKEHQCAPAEAKSAEVKTTLRRDTIVLRDANGNPIDAALSDAEFTAMQARADAMFANQQLGEQMLVVQIDGEAYLQMPVVAESGETHMALVPLAEIQMVQVEMNGAGYSLSVHSISPAAALSAPPIFAQRRWDVPEKLAKELFGGNLEAEKMAARLREEQALLQRLIEKMEEEQKAREAKLCELAPPAVFTMMVTDVPVMPACFMPDETPELRSPPPALIATSALVI